MDALEAIEPASAYPTLTAVGLTRGVATQAGL
jgi:hypothetical protein